MNHKKQKQFRKGKVGDRFRTVKLNNDNIHKKNRKDLTKIIVLAVFLLLSVIGTSYAFFRFSVDSEKETEIVAGTFKVEFEEGNEIHLTNLAPMSDSEGMSTDSYHFKIKNTGDVNAKYNLSLEELVASSSTLDRKYIRYSMKMGDGNWSEARYLSDGLLLDSGSLSAESGKDEIDYELKMWLREDADNSVQGKTYAARIVVSAVQDNTKEQDIIDTTTPVIVLNGDSSVNVEQGTSYSDAGVSKIVDDKDQIPTSSIDITYYYLNQDTLEEVDQIDTTRLGTYCIYYQVRDNNGNVGTTVRNVNIIKRNTVAPTISLNGDSIVKIYQGDSYVELGAKAVDSNNLDITKQIKIVGSPNTKILGTYVVNYIVNDFNGNTASVSRTIIVEKKGNIIIHTTEPILNDGNISFDVDAESEDGEIDGYYFSKSDKRPTTKEFKSISRTRKYTTTETVTKNGTYYIWVKDTNKNVVNKTIEISNIDDRGPECKFSNNKYFGLNVTHSIDLICADDSRLQPTYLTEKDFLINNEEVASIINISGIQKVEKGNRYTLDIRGKKLGDFTLTLKRGSILDVFGNPNQKITSDELGVVDITLNKEKVNLNISGTNTHQIEVTGATGPISYVSDNESIATVDENGLVRAVSSGIATITVTDTESGAFKTLKVDIVDKLSVSFVKQGRGVTRILDSSGEEITTASCKLTDENRDSCVIEILPTIEVKNGYEAIGWNTDASAHDGEMTRITITKDTKQLYSISKKKAVTFEANWKPNGNTLSNEKKTTSCDIPEVYNDEDISINSCTVQAPTILAAATTPKVLGFSNKESDHTNIVLESGATLTLSEENTGRTWYAQTKNIPKTNKVVYQKRGAGVLNLTKEDSTLNLDRIEDSCTPEEVYNGDKIKTDCNVILPKPNIKDNYTWLGWNKNQDAHEGTVDELTVTGDMTLYPITLRNAKTLTASFTKNGVGVESIGSTTRSCTIPAEYNALVDVTECNVEMPSITTQNDYIALGWSQNENAKESNKDDVDSIEQDKYGQEKYIPLENNIIPLKVKDSVEDLNNYHFYSISKLEGLNVQITWDYNGVTSLKTESGDIIDDHASPISCSFKDIYNNEKEEKTACNVKAPSIEREGFNLIGFSTNKDLEEFDDTSNLIIPGGNLSITRNMNGITLYAITNKTVGINWDSNGADIDSTRSNCTIYNNSTSCKETIASPNITREGFVVKGWNQDSNAINSEWDIGDRRRISLDDIRDPNGNVLDELNYYAITTKELAVHFYKNGAARQWYESENGTLIDSDSDNQDVITRTCVIGNNRKTCEIMSPFIEGSESTPHVIGYSLKEDKHTSDWDANVLKNISADSTYYAQTESIDEREFILTYHQQGSGVTSIGKSSDSCKIPKVYNGSALKTKCTITPLADIQTENGYQVLGWSQNNAATEESKDGINGYIPVNGSVDLSSDVDYYSISKKPKRTYQAVFHKNGAISQSYIDPNGNTIKKSDETITLECSTRETFNQEEPDTGCSIVTPSIEASQNTPKVNGYAQYKNATIGDIGVRTELEFSSDLEDGSKKDYYAITEKEAENIYGVFHLNGATSFEHNGTTYTGDNTVLLCVKSSSYNGNLQADCVSTMPKINASKATPEVIGWSTAVDAHIKTYGSSDTDILLGKNVELYAQTYKEKETRTVTDYKEGKNVSKVGDKTDDNSQCTIPRSYNGEEQSDSCTVTPPSVTANKGYTAIGYSTKDNEDNYNNENYNPIILNSSNTGKVWYANAIGNSYIIEFYSDGKKIAQQEAKVGNDTRLDLSSSENLENLKKEGYTFKGWDKSSVATTVDYDDGELITDLTPEKGAIIKLYAVWMDDIGPTCEFGVPQDAIHTQGTTQMSLTCTDPNQVQRKSLTSSDFVVTSLTGNGSVLDVSEPTEINNGLQYMITIQGLSVGEFKIGLNNGLIADLLGNYNTLTESTPILVNGIRYTATFTKNGVGVETISSTSESCTTSGSNLTCSIPLPDITVSSGYTPLGWSQNENAKVSSDDYVTGYIPYQVEGSQNRMELSEINNNKTFYSISKKNAITYSMNFVPNGSSLSKKTESCTIAEVFNSESQAATCQIDVPTITREGFTILGFDTKNQKVKEAQPTTIVASTQDEEGNIIPTKLTLSQDNSNDEYYALTYKDVTATFTKNGADSQTDNTTLVKDENVTKNCTIFNSDTSCSITSPTIDRKDFEVIGYHIDEDGRSSEWDMNTSKEINSDVVYYAITSKTIKTELIYYYYYDNNIKRSDNSCMIWNQETSCNVSIPEEVKWDGHNRIPYAGLSKNTNSATLVDNITADGNELVVSENNTYYAVYQKDEDVTYYYYNSGIQTIEEKETRLSTINKSEDDYEEESNEITVPEAVSSSKDAAGNQYAGVTNKTTSMKAVNLKTDLLKTSTTYYAVYSTPVEIHYHSTSTASTDTRTFYKNGYFTSTTYMNHVIAETDNSTASISLRNTFNAYHNPNNEKDVRYPDQLTIYGSGVPDNVASSNRLSVDDAALKTDKEFYLIYLGEYPVKIYYYDSSAEKVSSIEETGSKYWAYDFSAYDETDIALRSEKYSNGPNGTKYVGLAHQKGSMSFDQYPSISKYNEFYAIYRSTVDWYFYNKDTQTGDSKVIYRNSFMDTNGSYKTVLHDSSTGLVNLSLGESKSGPYESSPIGLSTSVDGETMTVASFAASTYAEAYTRYSLNAAIKFYQYTGDVYDNDSAVVKTVNGTKLYNYYGYNITPSDSYVKISTSGNGPMGNSLVGFASTKDSMKIAAAVNTSKDGYQISLASNVDTYYAIYRTSVTQNYYNNGSSSRQIYRNSYFGESTSGYTTVLSDTVNGTKNFDISQLDGYNGSSGAGLLTEIPTSSNANDFQSVVSCASDYHTTYYTVYQRRITVDFYYASGYENGWSKGSDTGYRLYDYGTKLLKEGSVSVPSGFSTRNVPKLEGATGVSFHGWAVQPNSVGDRTANFTTAYTAYYATYAGSRVIKFSPDTSTGILSLSDTSWARPIELVKKADNAGYSSRESVTLYSIDSLPTATCASGYELDGWYSGSSKITFPYTYETGLSLTAKGKDVTAPTIKLYQNDGFNYQNGTSHSFKVHIYVQDNNSRVSNDNIPVFKSLAEKIPNIYIGGSLADASVSLVDSPTILQLGSDIYSYKITHRITINASNKKTGQLSLIFPEGYAIDASGNKSNSTSIENLAKITEETTYS